MHVQEAGRFLIGDGKKVESARGGREAFQTLLFGARYGNSQGHSD